MRLLISLTIIVLLFGCKDKSVEPVSEPVYGIGGKILSSSGAILPGAKLYCIYDQYSLPGDPAQLHAMKKPTNTETFPFELLQNTPNPIANSVYFRFSVPESCSIRLDMTYTADGGTLSLLNEPVEPGLYQRYFERLVETRQLKNGTYQCILTATGKSGAKYSGRIFVFVLSNLGSPNAVSDNKGSYLFNIKEACIGDSIFVQQDEWNIYTKYLRSSIRMLVVKDGYQTRLLDLSLIQGQLLAQDIILEENK